MSGADQTQTEKSVIKIGYFNKDSASGNLSVPADSSEAKMFGNLDFKKESIDG